MNNEQSPLVQQLYPQKIIQKKDSVILEYNDILPSYSTYVDCKRKYQLKRESLECVESTFKLLLDEIYEFLDILYVSTENSLERSLMMSMINKFKNKH